MRVVLSRQFLKMWELKCVNSFSKALMGLSLLTDRLDQAKLIPFSDRSLLKVLVSFIVVLNRYFSSRGILRVK